MPLPPSALAAAPLTLLVPHSALIPWAPPTTHRRALTYLNRQQCGLYVPHSKYPMLEVEYVAWQLTYLSTCGLVASQSGLSIAPRLGANQVCRHTCVHGPPVWQDPEQGFVYMHVGELSGQERGQQASAY